MEIKRLMTKGTMPRPLVVVGSAGAVDDETLQALYFRVVATEFAQALHGVPRPGRGFDVAGSLRHLLWLVIGPLRRSGGLRQLRLVEADVKNSRGLPPA